MKKVLFVCVENAGRSQMAEAFAREYGIDSSSAGTLPSSRVNPLVVEVMKERGINLSGYEPKGLTEKMIEEANYIVTMGCSAQALCPRPLVVKMEKKLVDWHIEDTKGKSADEIRRIMSQVEKQVLELTKKS